MAPAVLALTAAAVTREKIKPVKRLRIRLISRVPDRTPLMVARRQLDLGGARVPGSFFMRLADKQGDYNRLKKAWEQRGGADKMTVSVADFKVLCGKLQVQLEDAEIANLFSVVKARSQMQADPSSDFMSPNNVDHFFKSMLSGELSRCRQSTSTHHVGLSSSQPTPTHNRKDAFLSSRPAPAYMAGDSDNDKLGKTTSTSCSLPLPHAFDVNKWDHESFAAPSGIRCVSESAYVYARSWRLLPGPPRPRPAPPMRPLFIQRHSCLGAKLKRCDSALSARRSLSLRLPVLRELKMRAVSRCSFCMSLDASSPRVPVCRRDDRYYNTKFKANVQLDAEGRPMMEQLTRHHYADNSDPSAHIPEHLAQWSPGFNHTVNANQQKISKAQALLRPVPI